MYGFRRHTRGRAHRRNQPRPGYSLSKNAAIREDRSALHIASARSVRRALRVLSHCGNHGLQESIAVLQKSARLEPCSQSAATRSGKPNAKNRIQGFDGGVDNWTRLDKACRLDADDRHIFDHCHPFSHRALFFAGQRKFLRPRPLAPFGWTFRGMRNKVARVVR